MPALLVKVKSNFKGLTPCLHINQWQDKYAPMIPADETRSLVYLADEKERAVGFPKELADAIEQLVAECEYEY